MSVMGKNSIQDEYDIIPVLIPNYRSYVDALMLGAMLNAGDISDSQLKKPAVRELITKLERMARELRERIGEI